MTNDATLIEPLPTSLSGPDFKSALVRREDCRRRLRFVQPYIPHAGDFSSGLVADSKPRSVLDLAHRRAPAAPRSPAVAAAKMLPMRQFTSGLRGRACRLRRHRIPAARRLETLSRFDSWRAVLHPHAGAGGSAAPGPSTRSNQSFIRATWLPGQNHRPHDGHQLNGQPDRVMRAGTSPIASNVERDCSAELQAGQRLQRGPEGTWCAATSRTAAASSPRVTRRTATAACRGRRAESVSTVRPCAAATVNNSSSRAPRWVRTS